MGHSCKGCEVRKVGCHSACPSYLAFKLKNEERKRLLAKERFLDEPTHVKGGRLVYRSKHITPAYRGK